MSYEFDLFVIGAGSGGVRAARFAAGFGAKVAVAESRYLGGTCVNVGCVPKKLLVYGAHFAEEFEQASGFGWTLGASSFDWSTLIANKDREINRLNGIYRNLLVNSGVTLLEGHATLTGPNEVLVNGQRHTAKHILIATGGWPQIPEIPGAETSLLYRGEMFLRGFDGSVRKHLHEELLKRGMDVQFNADIARIDKQPDGSLKATLKDGRVLEADCVFYATGRRPMLDNLGLETTGVKLDKRGFINVNDLYQTDEPSILAIGDVIGRVQLTPVALAEGMAVARRLFKPEQYRPVDYNMIPTAVFSQPAIGTVGLSEEQALEDGHQVQIFESSFRPMKLTMTDCQERTFMKLVVDAETDKVLGCHMVGPEAGEIVQGLAIAMKAGATKQHFDETIGVHPTAAEEFVTMRTPVKR